MATLVDYIVGAFRARIQSRDWLSDFSRQQSLKKLAALTTNIAYPDEIFNDDYVDDLYRTVCIHKPSIKQSIYAYIYY